LLLLLPVSAETVYVRNQRLAVQQVDGQTVVQLDAFKALLTPEEARLVSAGEDSVQVTNAAGESRSYKLTPYRELVDWEEALLWLGYKRRESSQTGIVDWVNGTAGSAASTTKVWTEPSAEELARRREASLRRAGYRAAQKSYNTIMTALGKGGTEADRQRIRRLGYQIVEQTPLAELHWTFDVAATPVPNALCTGEGFVVVTEGLLALGLTDDELAGVLGHEVAHGVRRHAQLYEEHYSEARRLMSELRQLEREAGKAEAENDNHRLQTIRSRVNAMVPRLEFLADFVKNQQAYDQHEEEEADVCGMQYAVAAGFDPNGEGRALIKLKARSVELFGQAYQDGSRTHPPLKRRLEIQSLVQKRWQAQRKK
jgi:hypothetical protein